MDWSPINWNIVSHPLNWLTVIMMLVLMLITVEVVRQYVAQNKDSTQ